MWWLDLAHIPVLFCKPDSNAQQHTSAVNKQGTVNKIEPGFGFSRCVVILSVQILLT